MSSEASDGRNLLLWADLQWAERVGKAGGREGEWREQGFKTKMGQGAESALVPLFQGQLVSCLWDLPNNADHLLKLSLVIITAIK